MYLRLQINNKKEEEEEEEDIKCVVKINPNDYDNFINYKYHRMLEHDASKYYIHVNYNSVQIVEKSDNKLSTGPDEKLHDFTKNNVGSNEQHVAYKLMLQIDRIMHTSTNIESELLDLIKDNNDDIRHCRDCPNYNVFMHLFGNYDESIPINITKYVLSNYMEVLSECMSGSHRITGLDYLLGQKFSLDDVKYIFENYYNDITKYNGLRQIVLQPLMYVNRDDREVISYIINCYPEVIFKNLLLDETESSEYHAQYLNLYQRRIQQIRNLAPLSL